MKRFQHLMMSLGSKGFEFVEKLARLVIIFSMDLHADLSRYFKSAPHLNGSMFMLIDTLQTVDFVLKCENNHLFLYNIQVWSGRLLVVVVMKKTLFFFSWLFILLHPSHCEGWSQEVSFSFLHTTISLFILRFFCYFKAAKNHICTEEKHLASCSRMLPHSFYVVFRGGEVKSDIVLRLECIFDKNHTKWRLLQF